MLNELGLNSHMMPRDVTTCWNSTYDMLEFALSFWEVLNTITGEIEMKLRKYEMDGNVWEVSNQLRAVLKVSVISSTLINLL